MTITNHPLESQLFTWRNFIPNGLGDIEFTTAVLLVAIGQFPATTAFSTVIWYGTQSLLSLIDANGVAHVFELFVTTSASEQPITTSPPCICPT
jgi:hypothetical protein